MGNIRLMLYYLHHFNVSVESGVNSKKNHLERKTISGITAMASLDELFPECFRSVSENWMETRTSPRNGGQTFRVLCALSESEELYVLINEANIVNIYSLFV